MVEKRLRGALGLSLLSLLTGACTEATPPGKSARDAEVRKASSSLAEGLQVVATDSGAVPTFITGPLGAVPTGAEEVRSLQAEQLLPVLARVAPLFRLAPSQLYLKKAYVGFDGDAHFRYGVRLNGVDVLGAELRLHARDGAVFAANTNARGDLPAPERPAVTAEAAATAAREDKASPSGATVHGEPHLVYWREGNELVLAYEVRVQGTGEDGAPVDDSVLVNARTGDAFLHLAHVHSALYRRVSDGNGGPGRIEGSPPVANPLVNIAYDHLGSVYQCYSSLYGRDSYDGAGAHLVSTVSRGSLTNAFWNGTQLVLSAGEGVTDLQLSRAVDVMAHEVTHGVTDHSSGLIYSGESGGLNESISDIFGAVCEWYSKGKVVDANTWLFAEDIWTPDIPGDALRYMHDPKLDGVSLDRYGDYASGTDVHYSSGISNLAFYLLSQGGVHPRIPSQTPVVGIGIEKAASIFYKANVDLLLPSSTFEQAKLATEQAAHQLGYDSATMTSVTRSWWAVQVGLPTIPPPLPVLEKDIAVEVSGSRGAKQYFDAPVPEGARNLRFTLSGGTGDADMYVRFNLSPTTTLYDCRPYKTGNEEECLFPAPAHGHWYVMLNGYSAYAGATLKVTWEGGYVPIEPGVAVTGLSGGPGSSRVFTLQVPPEFEDGGGRNVHVRLQGAGNADLYVRRGAAPSFFEYDCRGLKEHSTENCNLNDFEPGRFFIEVFGAKEGYSDGSLLVTYD
ncbi:peptidase [Pyxidicoccus fallax]|uniref:Peptidase n=1 Tax=Pyxidicoccus fallax TaxID=394095 RepID=A0A848LEQ6_9BACT|nr:M4 family metallopeptidase [Pyxidicoccus fallax]NMO15353.1 peptidase [Pyxidicoccus fallax]NPC77273.1 peptidase [Pyxidicoccus fallax]